MTKDALIYLNNLNVKIESFKKQIDRITALIKIIKNSPIERVEFHTKKESGSLYPFAENVLNELFSEEMTIALERMYRGAIKQMEKLQKEFDNFDTNKSF